jgi:hypothetical protein
LIIHAPFVVSALAVPVLGYPLLDLPVHIVWVELIVHPSALLVFQELPAGPLQQADGSAEGGSISSPRVGDHRGGERHRRNDRPPCPCPQCAGEPGGIEHGRAAALVTLARAAGPPLPVRRCPGGWGTHAGNDLIPQV